MIKNFEIPGGRLSYEIKNDEAYVVDFSVRAAVVTVPDTIEEKPVTRILKKACLSNKYVREVFLPGTIKQVGDYAFARCDLLKRFSIPYGDVDIGKGILMDSLGLYEIRNSNGGDSVLELHTARLLAACEGVLEAPYLFNLKEAGSDEWFSHLDLRIRSFMGMDDLEGFQKTLLCGEEDLGLGNTGEGSFKHESRLKKVRAAMLRLMSPSGIDPEMEKFLKEYLLTFIKGRKHEETWEVVLNEHGDEKEFYDFLIEIGGVNKDNIKDMIKDMSDRHPEMKAYLMKYNDTFRKEDAFSEFEI